MNLLTGLSGLILLTIIWLVLDFRLGRKKHLSSVIKAESPIFHGEVEVFTHGKELFEDYFDALRQAKNQIFVMFYIVKDDPFSREFLDILKERAKSGVEVRLLLDRLGSWKMRKPLVNELRKAGVNFSFSDPVQLPFLFYSSQVRNHRKISIIDGYIGYLGGFNIGKEYIGQDPKLSPWRDYHLKIAGKSVQFLQREFELDWQRSLYGRLSGRVSTGLRTVMERFRLMEPAPSHGFHKSGVATEFGAEMEPLAVPPVTGTSFSPELHKGGIRHEFIPTEGNQLEQNFINLIMLAEKTITIGTPYFIPSDRIMEELLRALQRGVLLMVIVPAVADHLLVQEASYRYLRRLLRAGAKIYQFKNGFYHAKTLVIDDTLCDVGTANFDKRSLYLNKEINCYIYDPDFIARMKQILAKDIHDSKPLTLDALNKPDLKRSFKEAVAGTISYFL
jgi:cardiolipin synthase A/B